jgi:hypothetical protein
MLPIIREKVQLLEIGQCCPRYKHTRILKQPLLNIFKDLQENVVIMSEKMKSLDREMQTIGKTEIIEVKTYNIKMKISLDRLKRKLEMAEETVNSKKYQ